MHAAEGFVERHEVVFLHEIVGQRLGNRFLEYAEESAHQLLHAARAEVHALHALRGIIIRTEAHARDIKALSRVDVGVSDVDASVENGGFAEDNELHADDVAFLDVLPVLKPDEVDDAGAVGKMGNGALLTTRANNLIAENLASQLNVRHVSVYLMDVIKTATVDMLVGKVIEEVVECGDAQLLTQHFGTLRADAGEILDVGMGKGAHRISATARS